MKLLLVTLATCLALHSTCSQAGPVSQANPVSNGAMDGGMPLEDLQDLLEITTNLTRVQRAQIQVLLRLQQHQNKLNEEQLAAKETIVNLHVAENAKLSTILKETQEFCDLRSKSSELEGQQNEVSNPGCDVGEMYDGNCYLLVSTPATWQDAQLGCTNRNGSLASIHNAGTNDFIANLAGGGDSHTWIGASDAETKGEWKSTDGNLQTFFNWDRWQPNNVGGNQNCLLINYLETGKWNDEGCDLQYPYVCQGQILTKGCESGWKQHGDKCYKVFPEAIIMYKDASKKCSSVQAQVAALETQEENAFIKELLEQEQLQFGRDIWLSGRRQSEDSPFVWATGEEIVFHDWEGGQPQDRSQWCMMIYKTINLTWQWYTSPCFTVEWQVNDYSNGVLCEKTAN